MMGILFWVADLAIPFIMVVFGIIINMKPPKQANKYFGYRTERAMRSNATWNFAQKRLGNLLFKIGPLLIIIIMISKLISPLAPEYLTLVHLGFGFVALFLVIHFVEKDLKDKFDVEGNIN